MSQLRSGRRVSSHPAVAPAGGSGHGVAVVDPGFLPTTRQMAIAVAERVHTYVTPIEARRFRALSKIPSLRHETARRALPAELAERARLAETHTELARLALSRAGLRQLNERLIRRRNRCVDEAAAPMLNAGEIVIGQYGGCLSSFRRSKLLSGVAVLDYPIAHEDHVQEILAEEAALHPEFADTLPQDRTPAKYRARMFEEIAIADAIVVGSGFAVSTFADVVDPAKLHVIPYGVDVSRFAPASTRGSGRLRVLFAGTLTQRKGISYVLDAMRLLDPSKYELTLVGPAVGSGAGLRKYAGLYRHCAARPAEMPSIYGNADVLVLPSLAEGSALVVLEAMASGLPVIVTPNTGADAVRDGIEGFVVPLRSPDAIAERLARLQGDQALRERMGRAARSRALEFSWEAFHKRFRALLDLGIGADGLPRLEAMTA